MFALASLTTVGVLSSGALARLPAFPRQVDTSCVGNPGQFDNGGPYILGAFNKTDNGTSNGSLVSLVLGPPGGYATDDSYRSLATNVTYPEYEYSTYALSNGSLVATQNGTQVAAAEFTYYAGPVDFQIGSDYPDSSYCGIVGTSPSGHNGLYPHLTIYNDAENWWLCQVTNVNYSSPFDIVIYNATDDTVDGLYDFNTCYQVDIQLIDA